MTVADAALPPRVRMNKDNRRAAVFEEAVRIIGEQGFRGFSINALARRCGLTTAGLLHHFGSKNGLLVALLEERDRRDEEAIAQSLTEIREPPVSYEEAQQVLRTIVARNAGQPHLVRLYALLRAEALIDDHPASAYFARREKATSTLVAQFLRPHVEDVGATALQILALMEGLEVQWLREDCGFDLVAAWDKAAVKLLR